MKYAKEKRPALQDMCKARGLHIWVTECGKRRELRKYELVELLEKDDAAKLAAAEKSTADNASGELCSPESDAVGEFLPEDSIYNVDADELSPGDRAFYEELIMGLPKTPDGYKKSANQGLRIDALVSATVDRSTWIGIVAGLAPLQEGLMAKAVWFIRSSGTNSDYQTLGYIAGDSLTVVEVIERQGSESDAVPDELVLEGEAGALSAQSAAPVPGDAAVSGEPPWDEVEGAPPELPDTALYPIDVARYREVDGKPQLVGDLAGLFSPERQLQRVGVLVGKQKGYGAMVQWFAFRSPSWQPYVGGADFGDLVKVGLRPVGEAIATADIDFCNKNQAAEELEQPDAALDPTGIACYREADGEPQAIATVDIDFCNKNQPVAEEPEQSQPEYPIEQCVQQVAGKEYGQYCLFDKGQYEMATAISDEATIDIDFRNKNQTTDEPGQEPVTLLGSANDSDLAPRQREMLQVLRRRGGELRKGELLKICQVSEASLKELEEKGYVAISRQALDMGSGGEPYSTLDIAPVDMDENLIAPEQWAGQGSEPPETLDYSGLLNDVLRQLSRVRGLPLSTTEAGRRRQLKNSELAQRLSEFDASFREHKVGNPFTGEPAEPIATGEQVFNRVDARSQEEVGEFLNFYGYGFSREEFCQLVVSGEVLPFERSGYRPVGSKAAVVGNVVFDPVSEGMGIVLWTDGLEADLCLVRYRPGWGCQQYLPTCVFVKRRLSKLIVCFPRNEENPQACPLLFDLLAEQRRMVVAEAEAIALPQDEDGQRGSGRAEFDLPLGESNTPDVPGKYAAMSLPQLKDEAKSRGLRLSKRKNSKKADLIALLEKDDAGLVAEADAFGGPLSLERIARYEQRMRDLPKEPAGYRESAVQEVKVDCLVSTINERGQVLIGIVTDIRPKNKATSARVIWPDRAVEVHNVDCLTVVEVVRKRKPFLQLSDGELLDQIAAPVLAEDELHPLSDLDAEVFAQSFGLTQEELDAKIAQMPRDMEAYQEDFDDRDFAVGDLIKLKWDGHLAIVLEVVPGSPSLLGFCLLLTMGTKEEGYKLFQRGYAFGYEKLVSAVKVAPDIASSSGELEGGLSYDRTEALGGFVEQQTANKVKQEYRRLCGLIGNRPPFGDCQLVALAIARITGLRIVRGFVEFEEGDKVDHYWVESSGNWFDPLSLDWERHPVGHFKVAEVDFQDLLNEYRGFMADFPYPGTEPLFPLRWALLKEFDGLDVVGVGDGKGYVDTLRQVNSSPDYPGLTKANR